MVTRDTVCWLITGTTGIAAATARLAASRGVRAFLAGRDEPGGRETVESIERAGGHADFAVAELTDPDAVRRAVAAAVERFGRVDACFNVAGISGRRFGDGPVHECTGDGWDVTLDANAKSIFLVCREVLKHFLSRDPDPATGHRGAILNMASVLAFAPEPQFFATHAYAASKGAILAMTRSMAAYYAPLGVRVNAIAPSLVRTPMARRAADDPAIQAFVKTKQPLARDMLDADDVARAAVFLLSDDARAVTGDTLVVDGGWCVSQGQVPSE